LTQACILGSYQDILASCKNRKHLVVLINNVLFLYYRIKKPDLKESNRVTSKKLNKIIYQKYI